MSDHYDGDDDTILSADEVKRFLVEITVSVCPWTSTSVHRNNMRTSGKTTGSYIGGYRRTRRSRCEPVQQGVGVLTRKS
jgi:hypothetical protein